MRAVALALVVAAPTLHAQLARIDSVVPALMKKYDVPGLALVVVRGDSVLLLRGYGVARVTDSARVDPARTIFRTASVAKLFVATAVMQQIEAGKLQPNADVNTYLGFRVPPTWPQPITLEHLLTHTAGFDERVIGYGAPSVDAIGDLGQHLAANLPNRGWPPGRVIGYSNYGMSLAAHTVERVSGMPFDRYARERIFSPLGMTRTFYLRVPDSLTPNLAAGHRCTDRCVPAPVVYSRPYPVGLAFTTAADMARFLSAQLSGARLMSEAARAEMQRQHFTADSGVAGMSYAWFNQVNRGRRVLAHGGNVPGINNLAAIVPSENLGFYFVTNGGRTVLGTVLRDTLLALLLPARSTPAPRTATLSETYVKSLAGNYQMTRYAHRTIEAFPSLFASSVVLRANGSRLVLPYPDGALEFAPVDSLHFREIDGDREIAFLRDGSGRVTMLAAPVPVFGAELPATLERRSWHEGAYFMNEYVSWLLLGPLISLALMGIVSLGVWWWRTRRSSPPAARHGVWPAVSIVGAVAFNALWLWFGFGFIANSVRALGGGGGGLIYGVSARDRAFAAVPFVMAALAAILIGLAVLSWRDRWWDVVRRSLMTFTAVGAVATIAFLIHWNYLPAVF